MGTLYGDPKTQHSRRIIYTYREKNIMQGLVLTAVSFILINVMINEVAGGCTYKMYENFKVPKAPTLDHLIEKFTTQIADSAERLAWCENKCDETSNCVAYSLTQVDPDYICKLWSWVSKIVSDDNTNTCLCNNIVDGVKV